MDEVFDASGKEMMPFLSNIRELSFSMDVLETSSGMDGVGMVVRRRWRPPKVSSLPIQVCYPINQSLQIRASPGCKLRGLLFPEGC